MNGGRHRSQAGVDGVLVCYRLEDADFTAQGEPVSEVALDSSSHMDEVPVPACVGALGHDHRPAKRVNIAARHLGKGRQRSE